MMDEADRIAETLFANPAVAGPDSPYARMELEEMMNRRAEYVRRTAAALRSYGKAENARLRAACKTLLIELTLPGHCCVCGNFLFVLGDGKPWAKDSHTPDCPVLAAEEAMK